ncbi:MAG: DUF2851 family protein [Parachlamydiaceae bacterium]|nr:DUF2851 family protein [Parachlamydiaceae bacterium]
MTNDLYAGLLASPCSSLSTSSVVSMPENSISKYSISESTSTYLFLRERHLQAMWLEQKYFDSLSTIEGLPIIILSPGIWNGEAGPDFLKAHILIGDQEFRGDIEIHINDESWIHHQHHLDKKYNHVVLHVGYWRPKKPQNLTTLEGRKLICTYLEERLTIPEARILKLIDLDLYPYKHFVGSGTCANTIFQNLSTPQIHQFFRKAAAWRLQKKQEHLEAKIDLPTDLLAGGMAMTLGYKHNAETFLKLYFMLKQQCQMDEAALLAYALGQCGFFNERFRHRWLQSIKYQALAWRYDAMSPLQKKHTVILNLDRTRPANHPIRRLAILIKMILDSNLNKLHEKLDSLWLSHWPSATKKTWSSLCDVLIEALPTYRDSHFEHHYIFEEQKKHSPIALLGRDIKREMLVNTYLPLLFCEIKKRNISLEIEAFLNFYSTLPASKTKKGTYLMHRFFGDTEKRKILLKADMQQGAYQLHRDFCIHFEASCINCPFIERFNVIFGNEKNETKFNFHKEAT